MSPAVSVVVPTWQRRDLVREAVASVLAQTRQDFELIVVDDGSTDGTAAALAGAFSDPRLVVLVGPNQGTSAARNRGVAVARAPWIGFLDSDDLWEPRWLESQLDVAARHPQADMVVCDVRYEGGRKRGKSKTLFARRAWRVPDSLDAMLNGAYALPTGMLLSARMARALPMDPNYTLAEDTEFLFRFTAAGGRCVANPEVLAIHRHHASPGGERKTAQRKRHLEIQLALLQAYADRSTKPRQVAYQIARRTALLSGMEGRWREAVRPSVRWFLGCPTSTKAVGHFFRGLAAYLLPRRQSGKTASASISTHASES